MYRRDPLRRHLYDVIVVILEYCVAFIALRSTDSFAPSELRAFFSTNTQGSAKPPPWAKFLQRLRRLFLALAEESALSQVHLAGVG
jgi:hypothetical protein